MVRKKQPSFQEPRDASRLPSSQRTVEIKTYPSRAPVQWLWGDGSGDVHCKEQAVDEVLFLLEEKGVVEQSRG